MTELYKKMYACLVSAADATVSDLDLMASNPEQCSQETLEKLSQQLKKALLEAEEIYVSSDKE